MNKLLITGSSGFIGSYFLQKYKANYDIATFSFLQDEFDSLSCDGVDAVLHLSALVHQMGGASEAEYERVNVAQTLRLATKAKESGVEHFVFMSSVKVYGEESDGVYAEQAPLCPEDAYGRSKRDAEEALLKLEDESFRVSIIRTPIVYGYGVKANIASLVNLVKRVSLLPFGGIDNARSMVYIGNLCHLIDEVMRFRVEPGMTAEGQSGMTAEEQPGMTAEEQSGMTAEGQCGVTRECHPKLLPQGHDNSGSRNIFLASDDEPLSTTRLIELIAKALGKKVTLVKAPFFESALKLLKPSFHKRLYGSLEIDNSLTKARLNLKNPYSVEEGISLMLNVK